MNIEQLREFCINLPHTEEEIKWGNDLCFSVGKKMYCATDLDSEIFSISIKVLPEQFDLLVVSPSIKPAKYLARYKWISIEGEDTMTKRDWEHYIIQSYELVKKKLPKKLLLQMQ